MNVVLISTYELGHQPFGLTSAAAWLKRADAGAEVTCQDAAVQHLDKALLAEADLIGYYMPMHTATRIAVQFILALKSHNPRAHVVCFGLYAPMNEPYLRKLGVDTILGGEFEEGLVALYRRLEANNLARVGKPSQGSTQPEPIISLARQDFLLPDRQSLPQHAFRCQPSA
ncbi:MAG: cobalamin B12-binding domain-containing protein [Chloroflexi bacterium]|nr:cobalamin B12-binding domain-containing protein [Chloroflexota bacterium]